MPLNGFGFGEMLLIAMLVLIVFGPKRLPEVTRTIGKGLREFKKGMNEIQRELEAAGRETAWNDEPTPPKRAAGAAAPATAGATVGATTAGRPTDTAEPDDATEVAGRGGDDPVTDHGDDDTSGDVVGEPERPAADAASEPVETGPPVMRDYVDPAEEFIDPWATDSSRPSIARPRPEPVQVVKEASEPDPADGSDAPPPDTAGSVDEVEKS